MISQEISREQRDRLIQLASEAAERAYAPYSRFKVGAALLARSGKFFAGCNVENTSYGLTNCAERTAIFAAIASDGPELIVDAIAVVSDAEGPCSPCGACRQVIYEFGPNATVIFRAASGWHEQLITDLLPEGFRLR
jgi:cytidine deaminase